MNRRQLVEQYRRLEVRHRCQELASKRGNPSFRQVTLNIGIVANHFAVRGVDWNVTAVVSVTHADAF